MMSSLDKVPDYTLKKRGITTQRKWKEIKRAELRAAIEAFDTYRRGCAFCPSDDGEVGVISLYLEKLRQSHGVADWGR